MRRLLTALLLLVAACATPVQAEPPRNSLAAFEAGLPEGTRKWAYSPTEAATLAAALAGSKPAAVPTAAYGYERPDRRVLGIVFVRDGAVVGQRHGQAAAIRRLLQSELGPWI